MNAEQIKSAVTEIITDHFSIETSLISENTKITDDLGADSLDAVEILMEIEDKTGVAIPDSDVLELKTIGDIIDYVTNHIKESDLV